MAVQWDLQFTGTSGTGITNTTYTPDTGAAWNRNFGSFAAELNGAGAARQVAGSGSGWAASPSNASLDGTYTFRIRTLSGSTRSSVAWRTDVNGSIGYAIGVGTGTTLELWNFGTGSTITTFGTVTANSWVDVWLRLDGNRIRVWLNGNTGTPDLDTTDTTFTSAGLLAIWLEGTGAEVDFLTWDNVAASPGGGGGAAIATGHAVSVTATSNVTTAGAAIASDALISVRPSSTIIGGSEVPPRIVRNGGWTLTESWLANVQPKDAVPGTVWEDLVAYEIFPVNTEGGSSAAIASAVALSVTATSAPLVPKPVTSAATAVLTAASDITVAGASAVIASAHATALTATSAVAVAKPVASAHALALTATSAIAVAKPISTAHALAVTATSAVGVDKPVASASAVAVTATSNPTVPKPVASASTAAVTATSDLTIVGGAAAINTAHTVAATATSAIGVAKPVASAAAASVTATSNPVVPKPVASAASVAVVATGSVVIAKPVSSNSALALAVTSNVTPGVGGVASAHAVSVSATDAIGILKAVASGATVVVTATSTVTIVSNIPGVPPRVGSRWTGLALAADRITTIALDRTTTTTLAIRAERATFASEP